MKRMVDETHLSGSAEQFLAEAVRATPRLEPEPFEMRRVLARVGSATRRRRIALLRLVVAVSVVLLAVVAAAAVTLRVRATRTALPTTTPTQGLVPLPSTPPVVAALPEPSATAAPTPVVSAPPQPSVALPSTRVSPPAKDGEDPVLVLQAIQALRNNGDPGRASALLSQYLRTHPHGVLTEDALALSIEAANGRHDSRSAAELGRRYLAQFPAGRYRAFAAQATQGPR